MNDTQDTPTARAEQAPPVQVNAGPLQIVEHVAVTQQAIFCAHPEPNTWAILFVLPNGRAYEFALTKKDKDALVRGLLGGLDVPSAADAAAAVAAAGQVGG